jgi:hypothetical protein
MPHLGVSLSGNLVGHTLIAREVVYWSQGDEDSFFSWVQGRGGCVADVLGQGVELHISLRDGAVGNAGLHELIARFHRYVDQKQLRQLETDQNTSWIRDEKKFWYRDVFG